MSDLTHTSWQKSLSESKNNFRNYKSSMKNKNKNITKIVNKYKTDQDVDVSKVSSPLRPERNLNQAGLVSSRLPIVEEKKENLARLVSRSIKEAIELVSTTMSSMLNDAKINNYRSGDQAVEYTGHAIGGVVETGTTSTLSTTPRKTVMNHSDPTKTVVNYN